MLKNSAIKGCFVGIVQLSEADGGPVSENENPADQNHESPWATPGSDTPTDAPQHQSVWGSPPPPVGPPGAAPSDSPYGTQPPTGAPAYGSGGSGGSSSPSKYRAPASARPARRLNMGIFAGMGLLLLLIGIAIMALMATRTLEGVDNANRVNAPVIEDQEQRIQQTQEDLIDGGGQRLGTAEVCQLDEGTIRVAATAFSITEGRWPTDVQELVDTNFLAEVEHEGIELHVTPDDDITITMPDHCG